MARIGRSVSYLSTFRHSGFCDLLRQTNKSSVNVMDSPKAKLHVQQGGGYASNGKPFTVFVEGNIGSGKTTFLNTFSPAEAQILSEPVQLWTNVNGLNLLGSLYDDPQRWGFLFQSFVQLTMLDLHLKQSHLPFKLMERSIHSARFCFVENLHRSKTITDAEITVLDHWYKWIQSHAEVEGDLVVYLQTKPEVVYERIRSRNRKEECGVSLTYLQQLHDLHEEWLVHGTLASKPAQVIVVDANQDINEMREEFIRVKSQIDNVYSQQLQTLSLV